jgi:hypothetical protein
LFDSITGGLQIGPTIDKPNTMIVNGVLSTPINLPGAAFSQNGSRYLEIAVRPAGSPNAYVVLGGRQQILAVPYAYRASFSDTASIASLASVADSAHDAEALGGVAAANYARLNAPNNGNVAFGTVTPNTRLTLSGGAQWTSNGWTASMNMQNGSAFGWEANGSGQRFGIGQSTYGLSFFRTISAFGSTLTPAEYDLTITNNGDVAQPAERNGVMKAMAAITGNGNIVRCYNGVTGTSSGNCGISINAGAGSYAITFPFSLNTRFVSVTAERAGITPVIANVTPDGNIAFVYLNSPSSNFVAASFHIFVF